MSWLPLVRSGSRHSGFGMYGALKIIQAVPHGLYTMQHRLEENESVELLISWLRKWSGYSDPVAKSWSHSMMHVLRKGVAQQFQRSVSQLAVHRDEGSW